MKPRSTEVEMLADVAPGVVRRRLPDVNPVLRRELLERWRGRRAVLVLSLYVAAIGALLLLLRWFGTAILAERSQWGAITGAAAGPLLGRFLVENLLAIVLGLVLLVTPGYAAAQLSGERERRTLGLLRITLVRPRSIVLGKLGASSAWIVLLVLVTAPLAATAMVLGGVELIDLLGGILVIVGTAVAVAAIALAVSSRARRTTGAVVATYAIVLLLVGGTVAGAIAQFAMNDFRRIDTPTALYLNPYLALADATNASTPRWSELPSVLSPFAHVLGPRDAVDPFVRGMVMDVAVEEPFFDGPMRVAPPAPFMEMPLGEQPAPHARVWPITLGLYALLATGAVALAARSIGPRNGIRET